MSDHVLDSVADDLEEARAKLSQTREALERALDASDDPKLREAVVRLERMEAELARLAFVQAGVIAG